MPMYWPRKAGTHDIVHACTHNTPARTKRCIRGTPRLRTGPGHMNSIIMRFACCAGTLVEICQRRSSSAIIVQPF